MLEFTFTLADRPFMKERPRVDARGRFPRIYTPDTTIAAQKVVAAAAMAQGCRMFSGPVEIEAEFFFAPTPSWPKKKKIEKLRQGWHEQKPDLDNCLKLIKDALEGIAFQNDSSVARCIGGKFWGQDPCSIITIRALMPPNSLL